MQNGFGEVCKHGQLARSCEVCQLERDLSECRVALRELVEASDARVPDEVEDDAEISRIYHANRARALKAWAILRALATKEPQP